MLLAEQDSIFLPFRTIFNAMKPDCGKYCGSAIVLLLAWASVAVGQVQFAFTNLVGLPGSAGNSDGTGTSARFNAPYGVALAPAGNLYVADYYNHTIRKISPAGVVT